MKKTTLLLAHLLTRRACLWAALGLLAAVTFGPRPVQAAVTEAWVHRYSNVASNSNDGAVKVVRDAAGDIIVTGTTDDGIHGQDMLTIKYSGADGSVLWQQRYNGSGNRNDVATASAVDGSGNVVVTGFSYNTNGNSDYYTAKYAAADGALLWEQRYNGQANCEDFALAVAVDGSGNVVVTGSSENGTNDDYYTAKYAATNGALLWEQRYNGQANNYDYPRALAVDGSGNVVVTGSSYNSNFTDSNYYTAKYAAADGTLLWEKRYTNGGASAVAVDGSGNVVATGFSGDFPNYDYYTAKYAAADGTLLWEQRYNGPSNGYDIAAAVTVDGSGNVVVTGSSYNTGISNPDYYTAKYAAADGTLLWEQRYNGPSNGYDIAAAVTVDGSGNVVVTGWSAGDYNTAKYAAADGTLLWEKRGPGGFATAVAVDGSGNAIVTGTSAGGGGNGDYYTAKYGSADSRLLWEQRYNGPSNSHDVATAVAVDGTGNVVMTGYSENGRGSTDCYTAKYAAADGALLWEQRYNGAANRYDSPSGLALDGSGNAVLTGVSIAKFTSDGELVEGEYYTAKYAAADGALLWEKRYNGPSNSHDVATAVAVDGTGNVVMTVVSNARFTSDGELVEGEYYTAKYAAADGALLWEKRYNGGVARAVAVDGSGNVMVTGLPATVKYAAADGALLWEQRGPAGLYEDARAVAVDGSGNVVVTGTYWEEDERWDSYTAKYAAADGALLWEQRYTNGIASAVAVDGNGNVVVTGYSFGTNGSDYYTAKYAAADGALLWEKRGPAGLYEDARAVAVDGSGNVVVAGSSSYGTNSYDYYTAKCAAANGALLWEKRYNGPANGSDSVTTSRCLALGPNGMVAVTGTSSGDYATVVYRDDVYPISVALVPDGVRLRFIGIPGRSYTIERAPAVTGPWTTLDTQTAPASGLLEYLDARTSAGSAFYRTVQP